jgi:hypothetical protein
MVEQYCTVSMSERSWRLRSRKSWKELVTLSGGQLPANFAHGPILKGYLLTKNVLYVLYSTLLHLPPLRIHSVGDTGIYLCVEGLNCKRPIQCLASCEILTPHPSPPGECVPPAFGAGGRHTCWVERGWVNSSEDASCKNSKKNLDSYYFATLFDFYLWKNM